jgi:hypothetical protein
VVPRCSSVAYWLTDGTSSAPRRLTNNAVVCARGLYNIEARPACAPPAAVDLPVAIQLLDSNRRAVHDRADGTAPYQLWGNRVSEAARRLPNGVYYLKSTINSKPVRFTQACPRSCAGGGAKGMMMMTMCPSRGMA